MNPQQETILEKARAFAGAEIAPRAREFDRRGEFDRGLISKMGRQGYLAASLPANYGGLELDPVQYGQLTEAFGKACCSASGLLTVQCSLVGEALARWGSEELKRHWLPLLADGSKLGAFALTEPDIGSDARNVRTSYRAVDQGYVLNGAKKWISFGSIADFFIMIAAREDEVSAFLVERSSPGLNSVEMQGLLAARASHLAELTLEDVFVPETHRVGPLGGGFTYVVGTALDHGRYSIAWSGVAIAQASVEAMVAYARQRQQFNRRIGEFQLVQAMIADAVTKTHAARALCTKAGELRKAEDPCAMMETNIAKYFASRVAGEVASDAVQIHGGNGCIDDYPAERLYREARLLEIVEGTSQIQQQLIAKHGLRKYAPSQHPTGAR